MHDVVEQALADSLSAMERTVRANRDILVRGARTLAGCLLAGRKILIFGNGGSAADAQHIAAEFVNRFARERRPLGAVALTTDTSVLTSIANDYDFTQVFAKQVLALGRSGDVAWGISTSGTSGNVVEAMGAARGRGLYTMASTGRNPGAVGQGADLVLAADSDVTARIQECHLFMAHVLCDLAERILYPE
ncbi:MAG: SIS domain-containing protein [Desulfatibacillaceae bacterium]